jgi:hypothetical protein
VATQVDVPEKGGEKSYDAVGVLVFPVRQHFCALMRPRTDLGLQYVIPDAAE